MALFLRVNKLIFSILVLILLCDLTPTFRAARLRRYTPPRVPQLTDLFPRVSIADGFTDFFGASHIKINGSKATLSLDKTSGSGLASKNKYLYGFFSASIKLPTGLSPGVVVAFYMSNADVHPHNHDEIDIELLGHDKRKDWAFQTNIYANGSVSTGREEKFYLWFDPTLDHHQYTILWNQHHIVFLVDNIPVREFRRNAAYPSVLPAKPMSVYATIWDGSTWATHGGKYVVDYKYAPFVVSLADAQISGAVADPTSKGGPTEKDPVQGPEFSALSDRQVAAMDWARRKLMFYSYCKDTSRFKVMPPECK